VDDLLRTLQADDGSWSPRWSVFITHPCPPSLLGWIRDNHHPYSRGSVGPAGRYSDGLRPGRPGFISWKWQGVSLLYNVQIACRTHPASFPMGTGGFSFPGVKRPGSEAEHSPPSFADVKNGQVILPLSSMSSWHMNSFTLCTYIYIYTYIVYIHVH
jgi:hypothetical protein